MKVFIDIETVPTQREGALEEIRATIKPPGQYTKPESIQKWLEENAEAEAERLWRRTALDGAQGELVSIAWLVDDYPYLPSQIHQPACVSRAPGWEEPYLLYELFRGLAEELADRNLGPESVTWCGHNITGFDLPFLFKRSVILGVKPSVNLRAGEPAWSSHIADTMTLWAGRTGTISLDTLCKALGIESPKDGGLDGSGVYDAWKDGRMDEIQRYNIADVLAVQRVYRRLTFSTAMEWGRDAA